MTEKILTPREELAAIGFNAALRLIATHRKLTVRESVEYMAFKLERAVPHVQQFQKIGLPPHAIPRVLEVMKENCIPFSLYQLKPTKHVIEMHKWRNTKA